MTFDEFIDLYHEILYDTFYENSECKNLTEVFDKDSFNINIDLYRNYDNIFKIGFLSDSVLYKIILYNFNIEHSLNNEIFKTCNNYKIINKNKSYIISYEFNLKNVFKKIALYKLKN